MRKSLTPQEARLWLHLRALKPQGFHFRRQVPLLGYYPDFLCYNHRLIFEVDGGQHADGAQVDHDGVRDAVFARAGFLTHRVWNHEINTGIDAVVEGIVLVLRARPPTRPAARRPSPQGGGKVILKMIFPPLDGEGGPRSGSGGVEARREPSNP